MKPRPDDGLTASQRYRAKPETKAKIKARDARRHEEKMKKLCGEDYVVGDKHNKSRARKARRLPIIPSLGDMLYFAVPDPVVAVKSTLSKTAASRQANRYKLCSKCKIRPRAVSKENVCTSTLCRECNRAERDRMRRAKKYTKPERIANDHIQLSAPMA